jgi:hypothetical protein
MTRRDASHWPSLLILADTVLNGGEDMSTMSTEIAMDEPPKSFFERLVGVFVSPGVTFADTELFLSKIGMEPVLRWALQHSSRTSSMSPDQIEQTVARIVPIYSWVARGSGVLWMPLVALVSALIGLVAVNSIFGGRISFKTAYAIACYAYLVNLIYYLLAMLMTFVGDPDHIISNPQNPTPTSPGFFLNPLESSKPVLALAGSIEIFTLWYLVLLGIGFSEGAVRKVRFTPMFLIFLGAWLIWVLIKTGLATLG